jgi:hypothetical protein
MDATHTSRLNPDFKEFLKLLTEEQVEYLLVGAYAVGYHGYPRGTVDMDVWIATNPSTADRLLRVLERFGFGKAGASKETLLMPDKVIRMGLPPYRIEVLTGISGVTFQECYSRRVQGTIDGVSVPIISLEDLKKNKLAAGRDKDRNDIRHLP